MKETNSLKKVIRWMYGILAGIVIFTVLVFFLINIGVFGFMPTFEELENPKSYLSTEIYSSDNKVLGNYFLENRTRVDYNDISPNVVNALISTDRKSVV